MRGFIRKNDRLVYRILEILPGFFSWNIIIFPYWGIFLVPTLVAYFVLGFNVYWFYQSLQIAITATISHLKMQAAMTYNWMADVKGFPDFNKLHQVVIIPTYKEPNLEKWANEIRLMKEQDNRTEKQIKFVI